MNTDDPTNPTAAQDNVIGKCYECGYLYQVLESSLPFPCARWSCTGTVCLSSPAPIPAAPAQWRELEDADTNWKKGDEWGFKDGGDPEWAAIRVDMIGMKRDGTTRGRRPIPPLDATLAPSGPILKGGDEVCATQSTNTDATAESALVPVERSTAQPLVSKQESITDESNDSAVASNAAEKSDPPRAATAAFRFDHCPIVECSDSMKCQQAGNCLATTTGETSELSQKALRMCGQIVFNLRRAGYWPDNEKIKVIAQTLNALLPASGEVEQCVAGAFDERLTDYIDKPADAGTEDGALLDWLNEQKTYTVECRIVGLGKTEWRICTAPSSSWTGGRIAGAGSTIRDAICDARKGAL